MMYEVEQSDGRVTQLAVEQARGDVVVVRVETDGLPDMWVGFERQATDHGPQWHQVTADLDWYFALGLREGGVPEDLRQDVEEVDDADLSAWLSAAAAEAA